MREGETERGKEECGLWEGTEVGVNVRKEKRSQFLRVLLAVATE